MKIVFCSSEVFPFAKTGGLADVCGALPIALEELGDEVIIFLPKYKCVDVEQYGIQRKDDIVPWSLYGKRSKVYYIENEGFYNREGLYGDLSGDYPDNLERFGFYCREVLETLKKLNFKPDVIHCHDWQAGLIPVYLKETYKDDFFYKGVKTLFTVHNLAFQGVFPKDRYAQLQLSGRVAIQERIEFHGNINILKAAFLYADEISTVSEQYAKEIQEKKNGFELESVLNTRHSEIDGIVNGIDFAIWSPESDSLICKNYSSKSFEKEKLINKIDLIKRVGFSNETGCPFLGFVGRISYQKGLDLIINVLTQLMGLGFRVVIQGVGEEKYYRPLYSIREKHPDQLALCFEFDEKLAHQIYAGCDFFLMPSIFEPCGLGQLISMRYGTIPIVSKTGGFIDTVISFNDKTLTGNGFIFDDYTNSCLVKEMERALRVYTKRDDFHKLIENAFAVDFSWERSARKYHDVYKKLMAKSLHAVN